jgi:subtilisin family serine protease
MRFVFPTRLALIGVLAALAVAACSESSPVLSPAGPSRLSEPLPVPEAPPAQYIVLFKQGARDLAQPVSDNGMELGKMRYVNGAVYGYVSDPDALQADPNVESVVENFQMQLTTAYPTTAKYFKSGWQWNMKQIRADQAPEAFQGFGTRACIIDTGIDETHQDLLGKVVARESFVSPSYGYPGPGPSAAALDSNGHGTHVAATVTSNGIGVAGVAPAASLMTAKVFAATGGASLAAIWDAISWCTANNADVINMSLGGLRTKPLTESQQAARDEYQARIAAARNAGVVVVVSAGNDAVTLDPAAGYEYWPAQIPGSFTVGATAPSSNPTYPFASPAPNALFDGLAGYSQFGPDIDIWAPGGVGFINRVQANITSACSSFRVGGGCVGGKYYWSISGTSMSSPHVAGAAAIVTGRLAMPRGIDRTNAVEACLTKTGDPITLSGTPTRPRLNVLRATTEDCGVSF